VNRIELRLRRLLAPPKPTKSDIAGMRRNDRHSKLS
jgi:hypothetical protein